MELKTKAQLIEKRKIKKSKELLGRLLGIEIKPTSVYNLNDYMETDTPYDNLFTQKKNAIDVLLSNPKQIMNSIPNRISALKKQANEGGNFRPDDYANIYPSKSIAIPEILEYLTMLCLYAPNTYGNGRHKEIHDIKVKVIIKLLRYFGANVNVKKEALYVEEDIFPNGEIISTEGIHEVYKLNCKTLVRDLCETNRHETKIVLKDTLYMNNFIAPDLMSKGVTIFDMSDDTYKSYMDFLNWFIS